MSSIVQFKAVVPQGNPWLDLDEILRPELIRAAEETKTEYHKTTRTWSRQPDFEIVYDFANMTAIIGTDDEVYKWLDEGTKGPYPIPKPGNVTAKTLRFQEGYTSKTRPRYISSRAGGPKGAVVFAKSVMHPGIQAREFTRLIQKQQQGKMERRMRTAIQRAIRDKERIKSVTKG